MNEDVVVKQVIESNISDLDFLLLLGFILTVIIIAVIIRLTLQLTRARMLMSEQQHSDNDSSDSDESWWSLVFVNSR